MKTAQLIAFIMLWSVSMASATIVTVYVTGQVNTIYLEGGITLDDSVSVGTTMTATYVYDTTASPVSTDGSYYTDYELISASMVIGNYTFSIDSDTDETGLFSIATGDPYYNVYSENASFSGTIYADGEAKTYDDVDWIAQQVIFTNILYACSPIAGFTNELPETSFPDWSSAESNQFAVAYQCSGYPNYEYFKILGELTSIVVVPEPATLALLGFGGWMTLKRKRPH